MVTVVKVRKSVAVFADELAREEFLPPSQVIRSLMQRGMYAYQMERRRRGVDRDRFELSILNDAVCDPRK